MPTVAKALSSHLTSLTRNSVPDFSAAIGITMISNHKDPRGTTRNGVAVLESGGIKTTFPYMAKETAVRISIAL
jgi:hypothetical protein